jgi:hypothetical protein
MKLALRAKSRLFFFKIKYLHFGSSLSVARDIGMGSTIWLISAFIYTADKALRQVAKGARLSPPSGVGEKKKRKKKRFKNCSECC